MPVLWRIRLLGGLSLQSGQEPAPRFDTRQTAALLAYLAFYRNRTHSREVVAEQLWPDEESEATRSRLRTALWALRRILEPEGTAPGSVLITDRAGLSLVAQSITTDVTEFEEALSASKQPLDGVERADCLCRAAELYSGELLPGYYEEWVAPERERLADAYRQMLGQAARALAVSGDPGKALDYARRAVSADPLQESAHAALIELYVQAGRGVDAMRQYHELERVLQLEMGLQPSAATRGLLSRVQDLQSERVPVVSRLPPAVQERETARATSAALTESSVPQQASTSLTLESEGGAVPLDSPFYIERKIDTLFAEAVARQDSIVLVKGARQMGKTSLLARGLRKARGAGQRVVLTDLQTITTAQMQSSDSLFLTLAREITDQLDLDIAVDELWHPSWGWNVNFGRFLRREILIQDPTPIVWALDEVDRLFGYAYSADVFGLFRSWHNARSLDPAGPWGHLTLAIAYATEAHLFITDLNQSPFNVGTRLSLNDFTRDEVAEMNRRYSEPLRTEAELARYIALVGGQPYLVRRGLHAMAEDAMNIADFEAAAYQEDGLFSDHLRRMHAALLQAHDLCDAVCAILRSQPCPSTESYFRLQSAGVVAGHSAADARLRCGLYEHYLIKHLR